MKVPTIAGIDYSLSSPAICIHQSNTTFSVNNCSFNFLTDKAKCLGTFNPNSLGLPFATWNNDQERYNAIATWAETTCKLHSVEHVFIEGYSYGSTGRVFHIAENVGILKHVLWKASIPFAVIAPTVIKKLATGKGNADKQKMDVAFVNETGYNMKTLLGLTDKQWNPSSDIIDSYYICKYGFENFQETGVALHNS